MEAIRPEPGEGTPVQVFAVWLFRLATLLRLGPLVPYIVLDPPRARLPHFLEDGILAVVSLAPASPGGLVQLVPDVVLRPSGARSMVTFGHTPLALARFVGHLLTFVEGLDPPAVYGGVVHEEILTPVVGRDEAVALILAEPLNRSLGHFWDPPFLFLGLHRNKKAAPSFRAALPSKQNPAF